MCGCVCACEEGFSLGVVFHICGPVEYDECAWHGLLSSVKRFNGISESEQPSRAPIPHPQPPRAYKTPDSLLVAVPIIYLRVRYIPRAPSRAAHLFWKRQMYVSDCGHLYIVAPPLLFASLIAALPLRGCSPNIGPLKVSQMYCVPIYMYERRTATTTTAAVVEARTWTPVSDDGCGG